MTSLSKAQSPDPAHWIIKRITTFAKDVGSIVPEGFEAYARVFHHAGKSSSLDDYETVTWTEIALANGKTVHPEMQFESIVPPGSFDRAMNMKISQPGLWEAPPEEGCLDKPIIESLIPLLAKHTTTPKQCWFAFWGGWGIPVMVAFAPSQGTVDPALDRTHERFVGAMHEKMRAPSVKLPSREYFLLQGPVAAATQSWYEPPLDDDYQSPSLWWPDDRSWCVATEVDFMSTYIGGTKDCIAGVLENPQIEALEVKISDSIGGDPINSPEGG
ncbi:MAG: hypothetical protein ACRD1T_01485 [Acidimicrobiia bacterium]